jgi:poly(A) polymerase
MSSDKPTILQRAEHNVSRKQIDRDALYVMQHLNRNGFKAYLVGGSVRDIMLGRQPKDFDISTDAEPGQIKRLFRNCFLVGRRFRLAHIRFGGNRVIETSTFRKQPAPSESTDNLVQWDDNQFGSPREDAFRRDFTINALFYDLDGFCVIDHVSGLSDLRRKLIRTIGDPNVRFREDPVRMVRAVRFAGRLGFKIEARTKRAIRKHAAEITLAAPARLLEEMYKLFAMSSAYASFFLLWKLGLMEHLWPEVVSYIEKTGGRKSPVWASLQALDLGRFDKNAIGPDLMLAALLQAPMLASDDPENLLRNHDSCSCWIEPMAIRFRMPKGVRFRLIRFVENQIRMRKFLPGQEWSRREKSKLRFLSHVAFPGSMALLQIRVAAGLEDRDVLVFWEEAVRQNASLIPSGNAHEARDQTHRRRRPRRRRRRPSRES